MPLHDWTRVASGLYHHFHQGWCWELGRALNRGRLPPHLTAIVEQRKEEKEVDLLAVMVDEPDAADEGTGGGATAVLERPRTRISRKADVDHYAEKASRVVIRHHLGRIVAFIEIVSPGNKDGVSALRKFVEKVESSVRQGVHVLVVDPFPPTPRDPDGLHKLIWDNFVVEDFALPAGQDRTLASYEHEARGAFAAHIEPVGVGDALPDMPLFIAPGAHILVPLEETYLAAWDGTPAPIRRLVEA